MGSDQTRFTDATSPVFAGLLLVFLAVVLAGSIFFMLTGDAFTSMSSGASLAIHAEIDEVIGGNSDTVSPLDSQRIRVHHIAGDKVPVEEIEVIIRVPTRRAEARVRGFPVDHLSMEENVEGDDILDLGVGGVAGVIREEGGVWGPGDYFELRVKKSGDGFVLGKSDVVEVEVLVDGSIVFRGEGVVV